MRRRTSKAGAILLAVAWGLIAAMLLITQFTGARSWDTCLGGNDAGGMGSVLAGIGAFVALIVGGPLLIRRGGGIAGSRWLAVGALLLSVAALYVAWRLVGDHPTWDCPPI
jgi:hypothetical protein